MQAMLMLIILILIPIVTPTCPDACEGVLEFEGNRRGQSFPSVFAPSTVSRFRDPFQADVSSPLVTHFRSSLSLPVPLLRASSVKSYPSMHTCIHTYTHTYMLTCRLRST